MGDYSQNSIQVGDVLMFHVEDRGDIEVPDTGFVTMTQSLETMAYLSHFGGNEDDDGTAATEKKQWWGNEGEPEEQIYRSRFHAMLNGLPLNSGNLVELAAAALEDLERDFVTTGLATAAEIVNVELVNPKRVRLMESITLADGTVETYTVEGGPAQ